MSPEEKETMKKKNKNSPLVYIVSFPWDKSQVIHSKLSFFSATCRFFFHFQSDVVYLAPEQAFGTLVKRRN